MSASFDAIRAVGNPDDLVRCYMATGIGAALAAAGTLYSDAALLVSKISAVSGASGANGVRIPSDAAGSNYTVFNNGVRGLLVYPPTGGTIQGLATNIPVIVQPGCSRSFVLETSLIVISPDVYGTFAAEVTFTETTVAGVYTGSVDVPAGATIEDIIVNGVALWDTGTSATMKVGDAADDDGYYTGINLKATDLLAGESISFALAGGKAGAYIANSQVSPRYSATQRVIAGIVTTVGVGTAGRTRMTVLYSHGPTVPAIKV